MVSDKLPYACHMHDFKPVAERLNSYYPEQPIHVIIGLVMREMGGMPNPNRIRDYLEELREDEPG
jgi:hypothetical protein